MPTDCDVNQKSEPIWVLLIQSDGRLSIKKPRYRRMFLLNLLYSLYSLSWLYEISNIKKLLIIEKYLLRIMTGKNYRWQMSVFVKFNSLVTSVITSHVAFSTVDAHFRVDQSDNMLPINKKFH